MKTTILAIFMMLTISSMSASSSDKNTVEEEQKTLEVKDRKILIAYFSWGGTTQQVAENIAVHTGGTLFKIETVTPYPTDYTPCTVVAKEELDKGIRPELKTIVDNLDDYDTIFIGSPVWWHTAPMAIWSFLESENYDFSGKTIVPFCTYQATYRDETLAKIVELTPESEHLKGFGTTNRNADVTSWLNEIGIMINE